VLALLLLHANEVVPLDRLIDELWGESPPESAANIVQGYVSHLRKVLEPGRGRGEHQLLVSRPPGYMLCVRPEQYDAERFVSLGVQGRRLLDDGDAATAAARLREGLALWRGPALADLAYEPFARADAERLEELRLGAVEDRIDADLALGRHRDVVGELGELVAEHPLSERMRGQLMLALYRSGRQADALAVYRDGRDVLDAELGVEPGLALRELERKVLQHDPSLGPSEGPPLGVVGGGRRRRRLMLAAAVGASTALVAGAIGFATRGGSPAKAAVIVYPHSVAVIDPSTARLVDDVLVGDYPTALAADERYVYVCNAGAATVSQIDAQSRKVFDTFGLSRATDLYAGNGHLWAADGGAPGHTPLGVGPGTVLDWGPGPTLKTLRVGPSMDGSEQQTTLAADGPDPYSIWVGNENSATIRQIDASLGRTLLTIHGVAPGGLAVVGNSSIGDTVWATDTPHDAVVRIDEHARRIVRRIPVPGGPTRIAAGSGAVWVITSRGKPALARIDPRTNRVVARIPLGITPKRVALGAGSVWVTGYRWSDHIRRSRDGAVLRIDPGTSRIADRISLGDVAADGVVVSHGLVWVGVPPSA